MTDLRQAWRNLRRSPGFSLLVIGVLALGIGASTSVFAVLHATLLRPPPYAEAGRLVRVWSNDTPRGIKRGAISFGRAELLRQSPAFEATAANCAAFYTLTGRGDPEQVSGEQVSADFFRLLGASLLHGRSFAVSEDKPGAAPVAILGYGLWQRRFGGDVSVIGQAVTENGLPHGIIGVLPADFTFPYSAAELWLTRPGQPPQYDPDQVARGAAYLNFTARLAAGVSLPQTREAVALAEEAYRAAHGANLDAHTSLEAITFHEELVGQQRTAFWTLFTAAALVHAIACANVANLLLARFTARGREFALRIALGAGRARLIRQCSFEALLLVLPACLLGAALAAAGMRGLQHLVNGYLAQPVGAGLDAAVLTFTLGLALATGLALGLFPSAQATRRDLLTALRESSQAATAARSAHRFRRLLLVAEVSLSFLLLVVAGLLSVGFLRLRGADLGLQPRGVLLANIELPLSRYPDAARQAAFADRLLERLRGLPNLAAAALADTAPLNPNGTYSAYAAADRPLPPVAERTMAIRRIVSPGYFGAIGLPLKRGRDFAATDRPDTDTVALVNESAARSLFGGDDPLGRKVVLGTTTRTALVVGLVGDLRGETPATPPKPEIFFDLRQRARPALTLTLRTADTPAILAPTLRAILRELDPDLPLIKPRLLTDDISAFLADRRLPVVLVSVFGATALLLALLGLYSVMSYIVALRRPEIATRLVLGASPAGIRGLVVRQGLSLTLAGIGIGALAAYYASGLLSGLLYEMPPLYAPVYVFVALFVMTVSTGACWLSARQAARLDPVLLLRDN
jgi:predicted permease